MWNRGVGGGGGGLGEDVVTWVAGAASCEAGRASRRVGGGCCCCCGYGEGCCWGGCGECSCDTLMYVKESWLSLVRAAGTAERGRPCCCRHGVSAPCS